ncbi:hypothetical protein L226DRAFT_379100 [Lentinus tigrinus ALCF2SS1-7]|uniref:uncharacterized protein n=1 Tax=Lentinus tigrinus ALCF2SS1-7 TaxID=1328758 RepID=UPI00116626B6|nr:hypothetical protein L226DRAFT_379100 [Lentinus tigrinus ALCF2SS1-7]
MHIMVTGGDAVTAAFVCTDGLRRHCLCSGQRGSVWAGAHQKTCFSAPGCRTWQSGRWESVVLLRGQLRVSDLTFPYQEHITFVTPQSQIPPVVQTLVTANSHIWTGYLPWGRALRPDRLSRHMLPCTPAWHSASIAHLRLSIVSSGRSSPPLPSHRAQRLPRPLPHVYLRPAERRTSPHSKHTHHCFSHSG